MIGHITVIAIHHHRAAMLHFCSILNASILCGLVCTSIQRVKVCTPTTLSWFVSLFLGAVAITQVKPFGILVTLALEIVFYITSVHRNLAVSMSTSALKTTVLTAIVPTVEAKAVWGLTCIPETLELLDVFL